MKYFISHAREDAAFAAMVAQNLRESGVEIWLDQLDIPGGQRWDEAIENAMMECDGMLVVLSPNSVVSQNVMDEVSYALENSKHVVPLLHIASKVPFRMKRLQYVDFSRDYERGVAQLLKALSIEGSARQEDPPTLEVLPLAAPHFDSHYKSKRFGIGGHWRWRVVGCLAGTVIGLGLIQFLKSVFPLSWSTFDYGNPTLHLSVSIGVVGLLCGKDIDIIKWASIGILGGFFVFWLLYQFYFIVEEGIVLLEIGGLIGAVVSIGSRHVKSRAKVP